MVRARYGSCRFGSMFWSNSKTSGLDKNWPKTVLLPQQSKTALNWTVLVPKAVWKSNTKLCCFDKNWPKRYYFHSRAKQLWTEPLLYPKPSEKVIANCVVSTRTGQNGFTSTAEQKFHSFEKNCSLYPKLYLKLCPSTTGAPTHWSAQDTNPNEPRDPCNLMWVYGRHQEPIDLSLCITTIILK